LWILDDTRRDVVIFLNLFSSISSIFVLDHR